MASTKYVELKTDRSLLDSKFNGYKLSLRPIESFSKSILSKEIDRAQPTPDQYSYVHTKLFTLHNHLFSDPWDESSVYFMGNDWVVQRGYILNPDEGDIVPVWEIPANKLRKRGHFNFSLVFASETVALLSDGAGVLHIVETENRKQNITAKWQTLFSNEVLGNETSFVILDARCELSSENIKIINCILMTIEPSEDNKTYDVVLNWLILNESADGSWGATDLEVLRGGKDLHYCALEPQCNALYVASDKAFKFVNESKEKIPEPKITKSKLYCWQQTSEDITITLKVNSEYKKSDLKVTSTPTHLVVKLRERPVLDLELDKRADSDLTTWELKNETISVVIYKDESGLMWGNLVKGGDLSGEQILDPTLVAEVHSKLAHLCSDTLESGDVSAPALSSQQLEECDISESTAVLERLERKSHDHTHSVGISSFPYLFKLNLTPDQASAIVLRHDVDACIFEPIRFGNDWDLKHQGTLLALGYVQASKEQKKFMTCAPNMSYGVIAESNRHIFIYRQKRGVDDGCELRNRTDGSHVSDVAEQQLITLPQDDICGVVAANNTLFVLKTNRLMFFKI